MSNIVKVANNIAQAHILGHNAKFTLVPISSEKGTYYAVISHPALTTDIEEAINVNGLPHGVAEEYMHCRVHGMAARLISKLYPEK